MAKNGPLGKLSPTKKLVDYFLIALLVGDFYLLPKMNYVKIDSGVPDSYAISLIITLLAWAIFFRKNTEFERIVRIKKGIDSTKNMLVILMIIYSIPMLFATLVNSSDVGMWNLILPLHMTLSAYFLMSGKRFESNLWTPIRITIDDLMNNAIGSVITIFPHVDDKDGRIQYLAKEDRTLSGGLLNDLTVKNTPFLIKSDSMETIATYNVISYDGLNDLSRLNITISRTLMNRQHRTALSHVLIWQLFELYLDEDHILEIPYNLKRRNPSLIRLESQKSEEYNSEFFPYINHLWDYENMINAGNYIFEIISKKNQTDLASTDNNHEHELISYLFRSGLKYYHYETTMDANTLLCHFILLSSRFERNLEEKFWITINSTFAEAARVIMLELGKIKPTATFNQNIGEVTRRLVEEIQAIRLKPIENFIKYYDQLVSKINQPSPEVNEDKLENIQMAFDGIIEMMNNQLNRTEYSLRTQEHAIDRRQYRKEIVSGVTLGLYCLVHRTMEV
jgi:hypothetical protein